MRIQISPRDPATAPGGETAEQRPRRNRQQCLSEHRKTKEEERRAREGGAMGSPGAAAQFMKLAGKRPKVLQKSDRHKGLTMITRPRDQEE